MTTGQTPIGLTKGPGQTAHEFVFVSADTAQALKVGEFVAYAAPVDGQERLILARVTARRPLRLYPDAFLANPVIPPDHVASLVGYRHREHDLFELSATVIGYYDKTLGDFVNPRLPPRTGNAIYLATDEQLTQVLSKRKVGERGSAHVGSLLSREDGRVPIVLDVNGITSTHLAIIASTGAGKSYLAACLIEELLKPYNRAAILVIDPHGEYGTLSEMMNHSAFEQAANPDKNTPAYRPEVKVWKSDQVKVRRGVLTLQDLYYLLPNLSERMEYLLRSAYFDAQKAARDLHGSEEDWTLGDLQMQLRARAERMSTDPEHPDDTYIGTAEAIIWRLESVLKRSIFDDFNHLKLQDLFCPGRCSILQLNDVGDKDRQITVATLLRRLFDARQKTVRGDVSEGDEQYLPYPTFVLIEEAHHFAPANADIVTSGVLKQVLGEGRKFGVAVGLISQRPGKLDSDALSQCNTQFIMRIVNPIDQENVARSVETVGRDLMQELPALTKGQAIIAGEAINTPVLCRVRTRHTPHGAESADAPAQWLDYFRLDEQERRDRRNAPPADPWDDWHSQLFKPM